MNPQAAAVLIALALVALAALFVVAVITAGVAAAPVSRPDLRLVAAFRRGAAVAAVSTVSLGVAVLLGWLLGIGFLKNLAPDWVAMKPLTAIAFALGGFALFVLRSDPPHSNVRRGAGMGAAALAAAIGLGTLVEYATGWDFGIENAIFPEGADAVVTVKPGRMSPVTAANFFLLGIAILGNDTRSARARMGVQFLVFVALLAALLATAGYLYGVAALYEVAPYSSIAMHSAVGFLVLGVGVLLARPDRGWMRAVVDTGPGGLLLRLVVPSTVALPLSLGWLRLLGQRAGLYPTEFGLAVMVVASTLGFLALGSWIAGSLNLADAQRVAAQELSERERAFSDFVINNLPGIFYLFDERGRFRRWNKNFERVSGRSAAELAAADPLDFFTGADRDLIREHIRKTFVTGGTVVAADFTSRDGTRTPYVLTGVRIEIDGMPFLAGIGLDISEQRRAENEIRRLNADLERRVAERTRQLEDTNQELEAFSYSVSHDLRAPLRAIDGWAHILADEYGEALGEAGRALLQRQRAASQQMARLIDDLLRLARLTRQAIQCREVDVSELVQRVWQDLHPDQQGRAELVLHDLPHCYADPSLLEQVFVNLLGNAVKFSSGRARPRIEVGSQPRADHEVVYYVRDNGAGFDMQFADKLFEPFQRLHSAHEFPGVGVGLPIVQRIVHRHGGSVWAEGAVDRGATFYFSLPVRSPEAYDGAEVAK
ncbi:ATP-binding protein [Candidatus Binatia bacterium]|nr:ATP-binding protein [Candidatus Binatia bacterium]